MPLDGLKNMISSLQAFDFGQELELIVEENRDMLANLQREQMMEGRGADGEYIRPFYSEDPYFKTPEAAKLYAEWKQRSFPNPKRPLDVPNLYINGYFHRSIFAKVSGQEYMLTTNVELGDKVFDEHPNAQGLNEEKRLHFAETITIPMMSVTLKAKTGLVISANE